MEELGDSRDFHVHHDLGILYDDCWWSACTDDNGLSPETLFDRFNNFQSLSDVGRSSEMFPRNNLNRVPSVSHSRTTMVPQPLVVLLAHVELLFLRRESLRLLRRAVQSR